jgi:O-antigen ligase
MFGVKSVLTGDGYHRLTTLTGKIVPGILTATMAFPAICFVISQLVDNLNSENKFKKIGYFIFLLFTLLSVLLSGERTALVIFFIGWILILFLMIKNNTRLILTLVTILFVFTISIALISPSIMNRQVLQIQSDIINFHNTPYFKIYRLAYKVASENLIFGVGAKNFTSACENITIKNPDLSMYKTFPCGTHPHNIYLETFAENGLIGLFIFAIMICILFFNIISNFKNTRFLTDPILFGAAIGFLLKAIPIIGGSSIYFTWSSYSLWLMAGLIYGLSNNNSEIK